MERTKYMSALHESADGTLFVVLEVGASWERRGRRVGDRVRVETWSRTDIVELSPESLSALHVLAEARLDGKR